MKKLDYSRLRAQMVCDQLRHRGIVDRRVMAAMAAVPREEFLPEDKRVRAYEDGPVPIGFGQTISQPYVVAKTCILLRLGGKEKVLEIGAGSGYQAAVLAQLADQVVTVEIVPELARSARSVLARLGYENITVVEGDGCKGYEPRAPYDAVAVAAAAIDVPAVWVSQLREGGRIVLPEKRGLVQRLVRGVKKNGRLKKEKFDLVSFVPLV